MQTEDLDGVASDDGYRIVVYRNDFGLTVMPGDDQAVSKILSLVVFAESQPLLWYVQTLQRRFPEVGTNSIDLAAKCKEGITC